MTSENIKKTNRRKRLTGAAAFVLVFMLLMSATYAWFHMSSALNEFGNSVDKSVVLHDDFDKNQADQDGYGAADNIYNKDVYVENTGGTELFIRIRLDEYMEMDGASVISGAVKNNRDTWTIHKYSKTDEADCGAVFHDYWEWDMGGRLSEYIPAVSSEYNGTADRYKGGKDNLVKGDSGNKSTLAGNLMFMEDYLKLTDTQKQAYTGWILDKDGYAYWSQLLQPGQATGLLLDAVTMLQPGEDVDYYAINVIMEALDDKDLDAWLKGTKPIDPLTSADDHMLDEATDEAKDFLEWLAGRDGEDDGIVTGEDGKKYKPRPDLGPGKGDIYEEVDDNGKSLNPERIIDSGDDNKPGTADDEEWTKITDDMNKEEPPASDYDKDKDGYLTADEKDKWENAVEEEKERKDNTITGISIHTPPNKTEYTEGEEFEPAGMVLTVKFESGRTEQVSTGYTWSPDGELEKADTEITIRYEGKTANQSIKVEESSRTDAQKEIDDAEEFAVVEIGGYEWLILKKDDEAGTAELLSKDCVDNNTYHGSTSGWKWSTSRIYEWLNGTFYREWIEQELRDILVETEKRTNNPGTAVTTNGDLTTSQVYLLSYTEYEEYATKHGRMSLVDCEGTTVALWWLRTPNPSTSGSMDRACGVRRSDGGVNYSLHVNDRQMGIRPACTVQYK